MTLGSDRVGRGKIVGVSTWRMGMRDRAQPAWIHGFGIAACIGVVFVISGCAGTPATPAGARGEVEEGGDAVLVAGDMFPPDERQRRTARLDPKTREVLAIESSTREILGDDSWVVHASLEDGGQADAGEMVFRRNPDGSVSLASLIADTPQALSDGQARYIFEPPLVMTPARLAAGERFEDSCDMRIVAIDDETDVIRTGGATRLLEVVGRQTLETVTGDVRAIRVRARFRLTLGATVVTSDSVVWFEPGGGALAESTRRVVRVLGVPVQDVRELTQEASSLGE